MALFKGTLIERVYIPKGFKCPLILTPMLVMQTSVARHEGMDGTGVGAHPNASLAEATVENHG